MSTNTLPPKPHNLFPVWLAVTLALLWTIVWDLGVEFQDLLYGVEDMGEYLSRYGTPNFSNISSYLYLLGETLVTAFWGTALALSSPRLFHPMRHGHWHPMRLSIAWPVNC